MDINDGDPLLNWLNMHHIEKGHVDAWRNINNFYIIYDDLILIR